MTVAVYGPRSTCSVAVQVRGTSAAQADPDDILLPQLQDVARASLHQECRVEGSSSHCLRYKSHVSFNTRETPYHLDTPSCVPLCFCPSALENLLLPARLGGCSFLQYSTFSPPCLGPQPFQVRAVHIYRLIISFSCSPFSS